MPLTRAAVKRIQQQTHPSSSTIGDGEAEASSAGAPGTSAFFNWQNVHPLMNDAVLSVLFAHVKPVDLLTFRLVCKKWNRLTLPHLRNKCSAITLYDIDHSDPNPNPYRGCGCCQPKTNRSMAAFINLFRSNTLGIPFTKFNWEFYEILANARERKMFLQLCGGIMREIDLGSCECEVKHITEILQNSPNLEQFKIPYDFSSKTKNVKLFPDSMKSKSKLSLTKLKTLVISDGLETAKEVCPTFFKELFDVAQNISSICMESTEDEEISEVLKTIQVSKRESSIEYFTFQKISPANLEILREMIVKNNGLKLKILKISEVYLSKTDNVWFKLIHLCKDDLVEFSADDPGYNTKSDTTITIEFPRMIKLKSLHVAVAEKINLKSSDFRNTFPALEKLCLSHGVNCINQFFTGDEISPLKSLTIESIPVDMETMDRIIFILPALKKFTIVVTEDGINIVKKLWNEMKQLEELDLKIGINTKFNVDSLMTGILPRECQKIKTNKYLEWDVINEMSKELRADKLLAVAEQHRVDASITALTNLRRFTLTLTLSSEGEQVNHVSDVTGFLGLYLMKSLKHIRIDKCQFTKLCCETLVADLELESWEFMRSSSMNCRPDHIIPCKLYPYDDEEEDY